MLRPLILGLSTESPTPFIKEYTLKYREPSESSISLLDVSRYVP